MKLELNDLTISYRRAGKGPPLLLIPPFPLSRLAWDDTLALLAPNRTVVAIDLPGFGGSDPTPAAETTVVTYAEACEAVCDKVAPDVPWILCGMSMGGYVIFEMVRRANVAIRALVLADTRALADTPAQRDGRAKFAKEFEKSGVNALIDGLLPKMLTEKCDAKVRGQVERWMRHANLEGVRGALHALISRPDSVPTLRQIDVPVLAVVGEGDTISPPKEMEAMVAKLKDAQLVKIANASHYSHLEQPERFHEALLEWLEALSPDDEDEDDDEDEEDDDDDEERGGGDDDDDNDSGYVDDED